MRDWSWLRMTENGTTEPVTCNSIWEQLSSWDTAHSGSGKFCFPKASPKTQSSIKWSFGQLCSTNIFFLIGRGTHMQLLWLLWADELTMIFCVLGWHFLIFKGNSPAWRSAIWLLTHWQATRSTNGTWPCSMDSGYGVQQLEVARTTQVETQPSGHLVK